jgi:hypothetical protein
MWQNQFFEALCHDRVDHAGIPFESVVGDHGYKTAKKSLLFPLIVTGQHFSDLGKR